MSADSSAIILKVCNDTRVLTETGCRSVDYIGIKKQMNFALVYYPKPDISEVSRRLARE